MKYINPGAIGSSGDIVWFCLPLNQKVINRLSRKFDFWQEVDEHILNNTTLYDYLESMGYLGFTQKYGCDLHIIIDTHIIILIRKIGDWELVVKEIEEEIKNGSNKTKNNIPTHTKR